jgi:hypothetical protein
MTSIDQARSLTDEIDMPQFRAAQWMTIGFAFLFFGVGAVRQYIAVWFQDLGIPHVGKIFLVLDYLFYFLGSLQAQRVINQLGCRFCLQAGSLVYRLLIASIWSGSELRSYVSKAASGIMASLLWTGQTLVLNRITDIELRSPRSAIFGHGIRQSWAIATRSSPVSTSRFSTDGRLSD